MSFKRVIVCCIDQAKLLTRWRCAKSEEFFVASSHYADIFMVPFPLRIDLFFVWLIATVGALSEGEWTYHQHWRFAGLARGWGGYDRDVVEFEVVFFPHSKKKNEKNENSSGVFFSCWAWVFNRGWWWFSKDRRRLGLMVFFGGIAKWRNWVEKNDDILKMTEIGLTQLIGGLFRMYRLYYIYTCKNVIIV